MKDFLKKNIVVIIYFLLIFYLEIMFKLLTNNNIFNFSLLLIFIYSLFMSFILSFLTSLFNHKVNKVIMYIMSILIMFLYSLELCVYKIFGFYFNLSLLAATDQVIDFASDGLLLVLKNILYIMILFIPLIIMITLNKKIIIKKKSILNNSIFVGIGIIIFIGFNIVLKIRKGEEYELYYNVNNIELSIKKLGVMNSFFLDLERNIIGFEEKINLDIPNIDNSNIDNIEENKEYKYNNLDIDFDKLIKNENNNTIKQMHEYFLNQSGTRQNEYTGFFKNKNLILFMAESFNEIAVDKDRTPTLYKLINNGFVFKDFYTPTISSTIGGE